MSPRIIPNSSAAPLGRVRSADTGAAMESAISTSETALDQFPKLTHGEVHGARRAAADYAVDRGLKPDDLRELLDMLGCLPEHVAESRFVACDPEAES